MTFILIVVSNSCPLLIQTGGSPYWKCVGGNPTLLVSIVDILGIAENVLISEVSSLQG